MTEADHIRLEILKFNHLEYFKAEKDLSSVLPVDHPRRVELREQANVLSKEINELEQMQ